VSLERDLEACAQQPAGAELTARLVAGGRDTLPALAAFLTRDLPIAVLERYEELYKAVLRPLLAVPATPELGREIAQTQLAIGLLLKYKSYAVKASSPLGYSLFLQQPGEGFSFQRHITHKTEVFHILDPQENGFVFLCAHEQWLAVYEPGRFAAWLAGERADPEYEQFRYPARAGDVFILDQLGIVHTVIGCILEEFATISTDMVERLHDQNVGRPVPPYFARPWVYDTLRRVNRPRRSREITGNARSPVLRPLPATPIPGGQRTTFAEGFLRASELVIDAGASSGRLDDPRHVLSLYVRSGSGRLLLGSPEELASPSPPSLPLSATDLVTVPRGPALQLVSTGAEPLVVVEHAIDPAVALVETR
jgi:hypothetical protein